MADVTMDQLQLHGNIPETFARSSEDPQKKGRNFAWSEDEKIKNPPS